METTLFSPEPIVRIQQFFGYGHEGIFYVFSMLGGTWGVLLVVGLAFWIWGREDGYAVLAAVALSVLAKEAMNLTVNVPRPTADQVVVYESLKTPSFPSGHVLTAVAAWSFLAFRDRISFVWPLLVAVLVGLGRLYLGTHFLLDVGVGILAGVAVAWGLSRSWSAAWRRASERSFQFYAIAGGVVVALAAVNLAMNADIPHRWPVTGTIVGLITGFLLQALQPVEIGRWEVVLSGLVGLVVLAVADQWAEAPALHLALGGIGALWITLLPVVAARATRRQISGAGNRPTS